jgi:putative membrane protein
VKRASELFSEEDRRVIGAAVEEAERGTAGEIVPVVATASGRYDRGEDLFGLVVAVIALAIAWLALQGIRVEEGTWTTGYTLGLGLVPVLLIVVVGFIAGAATASYVPVLRLPFIGKREMQDEVERGAEAAFQRYRVRGTAAGTGIVIYVSVYERMVRVLGDDAVAERLSAADWQAVCDLAVHGLRNGRAAEGLASAIRKSGELLSRHFPIRPDDRDELSNDLHLID